MEIKIDTKKDSPKDIKKTIEFLQKLIDASTDAVKKDEDDDSEPKAMNMDEEYFDETGKQAKKKSKDDEMPITIIEY
jgi:hypothetical protein